MEAAVIPPATPTATNTSNSSGTDTPTTTATLPTITTGTSQDYRDRAALVCARAGIADPFSLILNQERLTAINGTPPSILDIKLNDLTSNNLIRLNRKIGQGAFIAESSDFAAVACWEPPEVSVYEQAEIWEGVDVGRIIPYIDERPIFKKFLAEIGEAKRRVFPRGQRYWHLSLMARDPERRDKGAVRAIIEPFVKKARDEGLPIWLEAGNERARDVYSWVGGFMVVGEVRSGVGEYNENGRGQEGGEGVSTYLMVSNWPVEGAEGHRGVLEGKTGAIVTSLTAEP